MRTESPNHLSRGQAGKWDPKGPLLTLPPDERLDLPAIFGNARPVELEIGTGKGTFLLARAAARPEVNFIGIEYARAYALYAADRFRRHGLANVRVIHADASSVLAGLTDGSLIRLHVYFPDPWPKRKHQRRRLIQPQFVDQARRVLSPGGLLLVVTDHRDYFRQIEAVLAEAKGLVKIAFPKMADADGQIVGTNFERKYIAQGRALFSLARMKYC